MQRTAFATALIVLVCILMQRADVALADAAADAREKRQRLEWLRLKNKRQKAEEVKQRSSGPRSRTGRGSSSPPSESEDPLILNLPPGWVKAEAEMNAALAEWLANRVEAAYYLPEGQTGISWREYIQTEKFQKTHAKGLSLDRAYRIWKQKILSGCPDSLEIRNKKERQEGGSVIESYYACPKLPGRDYGSVSMIKIIETEKTLHAIIREWRGVVSARIDRLIKEWNGWFKQVRVEKKPDTGKSLNVPAKGYGFSVNKEGHVLTYHTLVKDCRRLRFSKAEGELVAGDPERNLALFKVKEGPKAAGLFRKGTEARLGDTVALTGFPIAGVDVQAPIVLAGAISALVGPGGDPRYFTHNVPVPQGNSGLALVDLAGTIAGMALAYGDVQATKGRPLSSKGNKDYAIKARTIRKFLEEHGVAYKTAPGRKKFHPARAAGKARKIAVFVECWKKLTIKN
ncbi:MAG: trypsin-like peptidase domain-containing protein [Rhodospirillales bacterium]|nr:trypsin-like peptidase domain-containing protein [Alphaproteobacteria bacterium]MBL6948449.1 trypsin-like peptidase domain-containing protein [Rhodospirillales bacterium]